MRVGVPPAMPEGMSENQRLRSNLVDLVNLLEQYQTVLQACVDEGIVFAVYGENKDVVDHRLERCAYHINGLQALDQKYEAKTSGDGIFSSM